MLPLTNYKNTDIQPNIININNCKKTQLILKLIIYNNKLNKAGILGMRKCIYHPLWVTDTYALADI